MRSKVISYHDYKAFNEERFLIDLIDALSCFLSAAYSNLRLFFKHFGVVNSIQTENGKRQRQRTITKAIMTRSRFKNRANRTGNEEDIKKYKKKCNLVVKLNKA